MIGSLQTQNALVHLTPDLFKSDGVGAFSLQWSNINVDRLFKNLFISKYGEWETLGTILKR